MSFPAGHPIWINRSSLNVAQTSSCQVFDAQTIVWHWQYGLVGPLVALSPSLCTATVSNSRLTFLFLLTRARVP